MDVTAVLLGAATGAVVAIVLTYWLVHGPEADPLTWLAVGLFFLFFGIPLGAVLGLLLGRRFQPKTDQPS
jgi:NhaP-type Na+/H+ or K+/H+ antiporter